MEKIKSTIENIEYTTYAYKDIKERDKHIEIMGKCGYECLENFEEKYQVIYRKIFRINYQ